MFRLSLSVAAGSRMVIDWESLSAYRSLDVFVKTRIKIHFATQNCREIFAIAEVSKPDPFQGSWFKLPITNEDIQRAMADFP
jgi:hypothetical protein